MPRRWHAALGLMPLCALALALGGCSFSYQLDSLFAKKGEAGQTAATLNWRISWRGNMKT